MDLIIPFLHFWWFCAGFMAFVLILLAIDLGVFHRHAHVVSVRESLAWTAVRITLALAFNYAFYTFATARFGDDVGTRWFRAPARPQTAAP